jgi:RNA 2',3'-cyclic 3'-phosphodiesterase
MRLFLGVELSEAVTAATAAIADDLRGRFATAAPGASLRWVPVDNLHVTVWFLGDVLEPRAAELVDVLRPALGMAPFTLRVAGGGLFPQSGAPRVVWLALAEGRRELIEVYDRLRPRLVSQGFAPEKRPYDPHLTIARVKEVPRQEVAAVKRILAETGANAGECRVDAVTLFKSRTLPDGARYERLLRVPLE